MTVETDPVIEKFSLAQNYPNPFNPVTNIQFSISKPGNVTLKIFNNLGQSVTTLIDKNMRAGEHQIAWDGKDSSGNKVSTGIYYYRIKTDSHELTKKMALLK
jgi:flagellar hook assembly protein FlgD